MVHTTGGSEKTDGGKRPRARSGRGRGQGQSLWIDLCVPSAPPETPRLGAPPLPLLPPPQSPGSHTLNSSHWALAWDARSAGCIERRSPDWAACSAMCWRRAGGGPASTLRVTVTPGWAFSPWSVEMLLTLLFFRGAFLGLILPSLIPSGEQRFVAVMRRNRR